jgi:hypothetical protein
MAGSKFADRASANRSRDTDAYRSMVANAMFADLSIREFAVLDEPTAITASTLAAAAVAQVRLDATESDRSDRQRVVGGIEDGRLEGGAERR